jgi:hypothetical protein
MNEHLRRALRALELGAADVRDTSLRSTSEVRSRLRRTAEEILDHLEAEQRADEGNPEDIMSRLDRQSRDIAEDLRRAERLMRERARRGLDE